MIGNEHDRLLTRLINSREEAIKARVACGIERRWREDVNAYQGRDEGTPDLLNVVDIAVNQDAKRSTLSRSTTFVQLTRQKTNAAAARLSDMLYPTDDRNFAIRPTPVPELINAIKTNGTQPFVDVDGQRLQHPREERELTVEDVARDVLTEATNKANAMQREIDDALIECRYNGVGRRVILDAAIMGIGIIRGPMTVNQVNKKWVGKEGPRRLEITEENRPASTRVQPENFWPDPSCGNDLQNGSHCWELEPISSRGLRDLARTESYDPEVIRSCLKEGPKKHRHHQPRRGDGEYSRDNDTRFELWIYTGEVSRGELVAAGVDESDMDPDEDILEKMSGVIVLCNDRIIKAMINPLDTEDLPYDIFQWERLPDSPYGVGVPYLMRYAQRTINAAWRALQDNAAVSHAPQVVMRRSAVSPADGKWELTGRKLWIANEDVDDVDHVFKVYEIGSRQQELENIINMAMKFVDEETALPQIAQGDGGQAPDTVGGMSILMNSANTVLRRLVKQFDDSITRPHIKRYYDWFMQYSDKEEIKGDFEIDARGSSALVVRDMQQETLLQLFQLTDHPVFGVYVEPEKVLRQMLEARHVAASDVLRTEPEVEEEKKKLQQQPPPQDPRIAAANIKAQADVQKMQIDTQSEANNQAMRMQEAADNRAARLHEMQLQRDLLILKMAGDRNLAIEKIKADLAKVAMQTDGDQQLETIRTQQADRAAVQ